MRIGISLNEVLRDTISQMGYTYRKYIDEGFEDSQMENITDSDLSKTFVFPNKDDYNIFLYVEASLEVFGHADQLYDNLFTKLNNFIIDIEDEEEHEIVLVSREINRGIPATLFFLSKLGANFKNIVFVSKFEDKWKHVDVMITASPETLASKPEGKVSVKVNCTYNNDSSGDFEIESIVDFITSEELRNKILT